MCNLLCRLHYPSQVTYILIIVIGRHVIAGGWQRIWPRLPGPLSSTKIIKHNTLQRLAPLSGYKWEATFASILTYVHKLLSSIITFNRKLINLKRTEKNKSLKSLRAYWPFKLYHLIPLLTFGFNVRMYKSWRSKTLKIHHFSWTCLLILIIIFCFCIFL